MRIPINNKTYRESADYLKENLGIDIDAIFEEIDLEKLLEEEFEKFETYLSKLNPGEKIAIGYCPDAEERAIMGEYLGHDAKAKTLEMHATDQHRATRHRKIKYVTTSFGTRRPNLVAIKKAGQEGFEMVYPPKEDVEKFKAMTEKEIELSFEEGMNNPMNEMARLADKLETSLSALKPHEQIRIYDYPLRLKQKSDYKKVSGEYMHHDSEAKTLTLKVKGLFGRPEEKTIVYAIDKACIANLLE